MMKIGGIILAVIFVAGCAATPRHTMVLSYGDFGPQAAACEAIGMEWWQWDAHGDPDPKQRCDVKVVVYRDIELEQVQKVYPVSKQKKQDYRYLSYGKAMAYLDNQIKEGTITELTGQLQMTRSRIKKALEKPNQAIERAR